MITKTCLLITDDPDDQFEFTEAMNEISSDIVLLNISGSAKAIKLIQSKRHIPDYIFLDLSLGENPVNEFLDTLNKLDYQQAIPTIVYGQDEEFIKVNITGITDFLKKGYAYSTLKAFLKKLIL
jgi:response regulator of citrate/malate metabolism